MAVSLQDGYAQCREVVAASGTSFAAGMRLFPEDSRDSVYALYAFFRHTDDIVDGDGSAGDKAAALEHWRGELRAALADPDAAAGWLAAVGDTARRFALPAAIFEDCLNACRLDCGAVRVRTTEELDRYCDGVAGTVGEACLRVLGYDDPVVLGWSAHNARAVQITNILRDLREDQERDRVYVPTELLARHAAAGCDLREVPYPAGLRAALDELAQRADDLYRRAEPMFDVLDPDHRPAIVAMTKRYRILLEQLRAGGWDGERPSLGVPGRLRLLSAAHLSRWLPTWRG